VVICGIQVDPEYLSEFINSKSALPHGAVDCLNNSLAVAEMGDSLAITDMGRKLTGCALSAGGSWVPI